MADEIQLAVLIDGDNIPSGHVKELLEEIVQYHKLKTLLSGKLNRVV